MRGLAKLKVHEYDVLPYDILLRIKTGDLEADSVYTLLIDKAFSYISTLLGQNFRRAPENARITLVPGFIGSYSNYSNLYFSVEKEQLRR
ncbi:MAG: fatty acid cis/trans isomerase [Methylococcaceae bacterium]